MQMGLNQLVDTIGARLKFAREERRMTQKQVAKEAHVLQPALSKMERGLIQRPVELYELARALRCNPDWLSRGDGVWDADAPAQAAPSSVESALGVLHATIAAVDGIARNQTIKAIEYFLQHPDQWRQVAAQIDKAIAPDERSGELPGDPGEDSPPKTGT